MERRDSLGCLVGFLLFLLGWYFWGRVESEVEGKGTTLNSNDPPSLNTSILDSKVIDEPSACGVNTVESRESTFNEPRKTIEKTCVPPYLQQLYHIIMERKGYLIHVTEAANLPSILKHQAILSMNMLEEMEITPHFMSTDISRDLDCRNNTENYVKLALDESYPMFNAAIYHGRLKRPAIIMIHPRIILEKPVKIAPKNSASNNYFFVSSLSEDEKIKLLDFDRIYKPIRSWEEYEILKDSKQAEILVKDAVPLAYFMKILVPRGYQIDRNLAGNVVVVPCDTRSFLRYSFAERCKRWW